MVVAKAAREGYLFRAFSFQIGAKEQVKQRLEKSKAENITFVPAIKKGYMGVYYLRREISL